MGATLTYAELLEASERAAWLLHRAGVRHGDRVALRLPVASARQARASMRADHLPARPRS